MWIFTKYGFFSAVCAREGDGKHGQSVDPHTIMVRARVKSHLEALKKRFAQQLALCDIREFPNTDYAFRVFMPKADWAQVVSALVTETDYDNFKSEVARHQGRPGEPYNH